MPPLAFVLHAVAAAEEHRQLAAHGLQGQPQFLLDLGIAGHGLLRFARERHPHAGHVDHERDRTAGQRAARLAQPVGPPVRAHHGLRDRAGRGLELQRHAVGIAEDVHRSGRR